VVFNRPLALQTVDGGSLPFFTFGPSWVAHLSSWGPPQSIFFPRLEDSYARFNLGQRVETGGILGGRHWVDRGRCGGIGEETDFSQ
jgi:hypothetical protein